MGHLYMRKYGFLVLPSHNRVYSRTAAKMVRGELEVFNEAVMGGRVRDVAEESLGGIAYVTFAVDELRGDDLRFLSNLSSLYALFEIDGDVLRPVPLSRLDLFGDDLLTILKYAGKTNEDFTKLLLNVTAMATTPPGDLITRRMRVFDPLCGRGTTLNQALMYGFDAAGVDVDRKDFESYSAFIKTWLKSHRLKHRAEVSRIRRERKILGSRLHVSVGASKDRYRDGDVIELDVVNADTLLSDTFFKPASFDMLVTDTPYGVQHASRANGRRGGTSRHPVELLRGAVPVWERLVRPGGAVGISWNTHVADRHDLASILTGSGFAVLDTDPHLSLKHRVDQAIVRDVIVARKPGHLR
ncbi:MAG: TRM11 family SAM-dependent methyltransferase [Stackebrandtia sp.]